MHRLIVLTCTICITAIVAVAQADPTPSVSPTPTSKRRGLDQFDLPNGIKLDSPERYESISEAVDERTYSGIERLVKYSANAEADFRSSKNQGIDPDEYLEISKRLTAVTHITDMYLYGLLDQKTLTSKANVELLNENKDLLMDMMTFLSSSDAEIERYQVRARQIAARSYMPAEPVSKRQLLGIVFSKINANLARLMRQVSVNQ